MSSYMQIIAYDYYFSIGRGESREGRIVKTRDIFLLNIWKKSLYGKYYEFSLRYTN